MPLSYYCHHFPPLPLTALFAATLVISLFHFTAITALDRSPESTTLPQAVWRITPPAVYHYGSREGNPDRQVPLTRDYRIDSARRGDPQATARDYRLDSARRGDPQAAARDYRLDSAWRGDPQAHPPPRNPPPHELPRSEELPPAIKTTTTTQFPPTTTFKALTMDEIALVDPTDVDEGGVGVEMKFHANESLAHWRTESWMLAHHQCLEMRYWVEGKRTRLLVYTCQMTEGGMCVLDKFMASPLNHYNQLPTNHDGAPVHHSHVEQCHTLRPWMFSHTPFAFHFRFVRRPRRFADKEQELRHLRRRHGRAAKREVGWVRLGGFKLCSNTCHRVPDDDTEGGWKWDDDAEKLVDVNPLGPTSTPYTLYNDY